MSKDSNVTLDTDFAKGIIEQKKLLSRATLQCLHFEELPRKNPGAMLKYFVTLSDGLCYFRTVFCNQSAKNVKANQLSKYDIITVTNFMTSEIKQANKSLIIVTDFYRRLEKVKIIVGKPVSIEDFKLAGNKNPFGFNTIPQDELFTEPKNSDITNQLYSQYLKGMPLENSVNENKTLKKSSQPSQDTKLEETKKKKILNVNKKSQELASKTVSNKEINPSKIINIEEKERKEPQEIIVVSSGRNSESPTSTLYHTPRSRIESQSKSLSKKETPKLSATSNNPFPDPLKTLFTTQERKELQEKKDRKFFSKSPTKRTKRAFLFTIDDKQPLPISQSKKGDLLIPNEPENDAASSSSRSNIFSKRSYEAFKESEEVPAKFLRNYQESSSHSRERSPAPKIKQSNSQPLTQNLEYLPIKALSCLLDAWLIKARVIKRSLIKPFVSKQGKRSKMFSIDLLDKENGEIEASFFGYLCDEYYHRIEEGKVYFFSGGVVKKPAMKVTSETNELQIVFDSRAEIREARDDPEIPTCLFNFFPIEKILQKECGDIVDVAGIVYEDQGTIEIALRSGESTKKRTIVIYDKGKIMMEATFWGSNTIFSVRPGQLIIIKGCKVNEFQGKKGVVSYFRTYVIRDDLPNHPVVDEIREIARNPDYSRDEIRKKKSLGEINSKVYFKNLPDLESMLDRSDKYYFDFTVTVEHIQSDPINGIYYIACPSSGCGRKVIESEPNKWRCTYCHKDSKDPIAKYKLTLLLSDLTGRIWTTAFDKIGDTLLGISAEEFKKLKDSSTVSDEAECAKIINNATMKEYNAKILMKFDTFKGRGEWRYSVMKMTPIDYQKEALEVLEMLELMKKKENE